MNEIEQSSVYPDVWYIRVGSTSVKTDEEGVKQIIRSAMATVIGKAMLEDYIKRLTKK